MVRKRKSSDQAGCKNDLIERLVKHEEQLPTGESDNLAIMAKRIKYKHENESEAIGRAKTALEEEEFGIATTDEKSIGNDLGLHIAEAAHETSMLRETLSTLRETCNETRREASVATIKKPSRPRFDSRRQ